MVLVLSLGLNCEVTPGPITERFEEVLKHLRRHISNLFALVGAVPDQPRPTAEVEPNVDRRLVHYEVKAVAFDAELIAQCLTESFAQGNGGIFDRVVLINVQVSIDGDAQVAAGVAAELVEHSSCRYRRGRARF